MAKMKCSNSYITSMLSLVLTAFLQFGPEVTRQGRAIRRLGWEGLLGARGASVGQSGGQSSGQGRRTLRVHPGVGQGRAAETGFVWARGKLEPTVHWRDWCGLMTFP